MDDDSKYHASDYQRTVLDDLGMQEMATRLCGSADLFATEPGRGCVASVNYVSCHDGFTLTDLTRYAAKHNEANGEDNMDGSNVNHSANFGVEGDTSDPAVTRNRERAAMNMLGTLMLSLGTPMMLAGDEFCNSQQGNNNAYAQDNDITWLDWDWLYQTGKTPQMRRLETVSRLISIRKSLDLYHHEEFFTRLTQLGLFKPSSRVQWYLPDGTTPMERDWFDTGVRSFTMRLLSQDNDASDILIVVNGVDDDRQYRLPSDAEWQCEWSSGVVAGLRPARGLFPERMHRRDFSDANWTTAVHDDDPISRLVDMVQSQLAAEAKLDRPRDEADGGGTAFGTIGAIDESDDPHVTTVAGRYGPSPIHDDNAILNISDALDDGDADDDRRHGADDITAADPDLWTFPALTISVMRQIQ